MENKAQILIVDDEPTSLYTLEMLLAPEQYDIALAASGEEALRKIEASEPDVILLDVMMPKMTGFELCQQLKADEQRRHIPIILVTALDSKEDMVRGLNMGADEFVTKPVSGPVLRARVRSMLRIKQQYDEIQETMELREDMADMIVHDMRTPITTVILYLDMLSKKNGSPMDMSEVTDRMRAQAHRLNSMLTDMLILAKMRSGKLVLNCVLVDLEQLVLELVHDQAAVAKSRGIELKIELPDRRLQLPLDAKLIQRTIENLLSNALKFSPAGSTVVLRLAYLNGAASNGHSQPSACIQIADQGPGVPEEYRERIFDRYEIIAMDSDEVPQIGIGLAFCQMVVRAHGGQISIAANEPSGAVFTVAL